MPESPDPPKGGRVAEDVNKDKKPKKDKKDKKEKE